MLKDIERFRLVFVFVLQTTLYSLKHCSFIHLKIIHSHTHNHLKISKYNSQRNISPITLDFDLLLMCLSKSMSFNIN